MEESYKLTYFNLRGTAEPIRLMFAYAQVPYEDIRIDRDQWPLLRHNYPWGQVPVLQVGAEILSQENGIARYLAKKFHLLGHDPFAEAKMDEYVDALTELRLAWKKYFLEPDIAKKAELHTQFVEATAPKYLSIFEAQVNASSGDFMMGSQLTWLDLQMAHWVEFFGQVEPGLFDQYSGLRKLQQTVYDIPQIKAWIEERPVTQF